jgi:hypothetical protein
MDLLIYLTIFNFRTFSPPKTMPLLPSQPLAFLFTRGKARLTKSIYGASSKLSLLFLVESRAT